ncbi:MAG: DUF4352 domain-containing protein [Chloroflexi bacterium]|nr:DUF4352 domain-containing protein [Chloroflexota bacterium]
MRRTPLWVFVLLFVLIIGLGVYAYFTAPLPLGLSSVIRTPGGANVATPVPGPAPGTRTVAGQPLVLGSTNVSVQSVQRAQDLSSNGRTGPPGTFTVVDVEIDNQGSDSLSPAAADFTLLDDRGRSYAVDIDATRTVNTAARRRVPFDSTVPPGARVAALLAFETTPDSNPLSLRVALGYGVLELPH